MGLFFDFHPDRYPPGSFQTPVQPPTSNPAAEPLLQVCFNASWLPYILGAFAQLTMNTTWSGTDDEIQAARNAANNLIVLFQMAQPGCVKSNFGAAGAAEDYMLRQNPDNPCELQSSVDGVTWCTWADLSLCNSNKQPAQGTKPTPPGGGCTKYQGEVTIGDKWMLPNNVSTGDTITVSHANGLWSTPLDLFIPRCPDGNLWFEIACVEGTGHTEPGDPAPAINHDSLIGWDGTNYYDFGLASDGQDVAITIPGGISQANFYLMCNTPDTSGSGNVVFDVQYCNNGLQTWSHEFNFLETTGGFVPQAGSGAAAAGVWTPGIGWGTSDVTQTGGAQFRRLWLRLTFATTEIDSATAYFSITKGSYDNPAADYGLLVAAPDTTGTPEISLFASALTNGVQVQMGTVSIPAQTSIDVYLASSDGVGGGFSGSALLTKLVLTGTGPDPFGP